MTPDLANRISRLTLGTVQLGMDYGSFVPTSPPAHDAILQIFNNAIAGGVTCLDTAPAYGSSETAIGGWLAAATIADRRDRPFIVTKLSALEGIGDLDIGDEIRQRAQGSLARLRTDRLDGYLVHRAADLFRPGAADALRDLVDEELIGGFGLSVYEPAELEAALTIDGLALVQLPFNVFDRRFAESGLIARAADLDITVFARSTFLQGVAFLAPNKLPHMLSDLQTPLAQLHALAKSSGHPIAGLCLQAVLSEPGVASVVVGASRLDELNQSLAAAASEIDKGLLSAIRQLASGVDEALIDPRRWT